MEWIKEYGLWSVLVGAILEGDWVMIAAGGLAHAKLMNPIGAWLIGALGAYIGHLFFYAVGRFLRGKKLFVVNNEKWKPRIERALAMIRNYPVFSIFFLQYIYGMRLAGAIALGFSDMPWFTFLTVQIANCLIWSGVVFSIGYGATGAVVAWLNLPDRSLIAVVVAVLLVTLFLFFFLRRSAFLKRKSAISPLKGEPAPSSEDKAL